jgi:hypothetical protein
MLPPQDGNITLSWLRQEHGWSTAPPYNLEMASANVCLYCSALASSDEKHHERLVQPCHTMGYQPTGRGRSKMANSTVADRTIQVAG